MTEAAFLGVASSLTGRRWRARAADERLAAALAQRFDLPEVVGRVLAGRGVTLETCERFLNARLATELPQPSRFRDMDQAAARVAGAIMAGEPVAVFGDYDVDGATSSALLKLFFAAVQGRLTVYIPDRLTEGYGPNAPALQRLRESGHNLVITVDCGTAAHAPLAAAKQAGMDVVVVDHHLAGADLAPAFAVINPNRLDESGACRELAAVGVAFLLVVAVNRALREAGWYKARPEPDLRLWLDLVALGTVCDMVPLKGLNRVFVRQGLKVMAARANPGLVALADTARVAARADCYQLGFVLGPRINAGGRVGQSDLGVRLLTAPDQLTAQPIAETLERLNAERRAIEALVQESALRQGEAQAGAPVILVAGPGWHPGVIGIVAGRLKERFRRPTLVVALEDGIGKGSGRSVPGVDLGAAVVAARQAGILKEGGGHPMAAGFSVAEDQIPALRDFLAARLAPQLTAEATSPSLGIDGALAPEGATADLLALLERAGPYGMGHAEPRFAVPDVQIVWSETLRGGHLRCVLAGANGGRLKAVAFRAEESGLGPALAKAGRGKRLHVAGTLRPNDWQGRQEVDFIIADAALA